MITIVLGSLCVLLSAALGYSVHRLSKAGALLNEYESFYNASLDDVESHIKYLDKLMRENVILQGDDSVKRVFRSMRAFYEMLAGYQNAGRKQQQISGTSSTAN